MKIELYPLEKIVCGNTVIAFGMEQSAVEAALGKGQRRGNRHYYFDGELAIDYAGTKVEFLEFLGGPDGALKPMLYGVSVFDTDAEEVVALLTARNNGEICDEEDGYSYQFENISVGLYREATPEEIEELIEETQDAGNPMSEEEIREEWKRANRWATVGLGKPGYYD